MLIFALMMKVALPEVPCRPLLLFLNLCEHS
jgi:hypothetical protein